MEWKNKDLHGESFPKALDCPISKTLEQLKQKEMPLLGNNMSN